MGLGLQHHGLGLRQQRRYRRAARQVQAQGQGIDEHAHHPLDLALPSIGDRRADDHILLPGQASEQPCPRCREQHERRDAMARAHGFEGFTGRQVELDLDAVARVLLALRTRPVPWQAEQRGRAVELLAPVVGLGIQRRTVEPALLPLGIIEVLHPERGQRVGGVRSESLVERRELADQNAQGPAIRHQVVNDQ